ncbi:MAG: hypothetical protein ABI910_16415 [Gemmatimonadota bacterium]
MSTLVDDSILPLAFASLDDRAAADGSRRERLRFTRFAFERSPTAHCCAEVELEYQKGDAVIGRAEGIATPLGDVRLAAEATLRAIELFAKGSLRFDLLGVKQMRAFDANVVIVSVLCIDPSGREPERRLLGCHLADEDPLKGAVVATLQATNRLLGNAIATR